MLYCITLCFECCIGVHFDLDDVKTSCFAALSCSEGCYILSHAMVDDINPALPRIRNKPKFPQSRVLKVMPNAKDFYHQPYVVCFGVSMARGLRCPELENPLSPNQKVYYWGRNNKKIGFWGPLYSNYNKEPPKIVFVII